MGCYKLTYHPGPTLFLEEQGERTISPEWKVWRAEKTNFLEVGEEVQQQGRPDPIDIWSKDRLAVLNGLLDHLYYLGHHPDEQHNLRDIVKSFSEPVPWWKGWIPGAGPSNSTGGIAKVFGGYVQWNIAAAGAFTTEGWKTSPANMNLTMNAIRMDGMTNFIDGTPSSIYQIRVWGGSSDKLIYLNFIDQEAWSKTYKYLRQ